jgi:hypothetical protein
MLQKIPEMLSLIEHQKYKRFLGEDSRPSYFPRRSLTCWGNGKEGKIGERETPRKRLGWENLIFFAASNANLRLLYIEYPRFPVTCFETIFVSAWLKQIFART